MSADRCGFIPTGSGCPNPAEGRISLTKCVCTQPRSLGIPVWLRARPAIAEGARFVHRRGWSTPGLTYRCTSWVAISDKAGVRPGVRAAYGVFPPARPQILRIVYLTKFESVTEF